jgi:hypothetical protein
MALCMLSGLVSGLSVLLIIIVSTVHPQCSEVEVTTHEDEDPLALTHEEVEDFQSKDI